MTSPDTILDLAVDGRPAGAELFRAGAANAPAIVVVHEYWGLNDDMRRMARRFAAEGFDALVVDLFEGRATTDPKDALRLAMDVQTSRAVEVIRAGARALLVAGAPRVGVTGFCLGGGMAIAAACNVREIAAAVPFYGRPKEEFRRFSRATAPIQAHYAQNDPHIPRAGVEQMRDEALGAGASLELFFYEGPHAFLREGDPAAYHEESARLAWSRATAFLQKTLVAPA